MLDKIFEEYDLVVGLEVHAQLLTASKAYAPDRNEYGTEPNTNVSAITLGHPGTLPRLNEKVIDFAVRLGLAMDSEITREMHFARKNYFYPDLPKGYQITQDDTPICTGGHVDLKLKDGTESRIGITRIHIEEDAGKSMHDLDPHNTLIDLNRAGVPLLEIVSEPDIRKPEEAYAYLTEVRKLVRYLEVCDGNMEEGSMRCDANVSIMPKGASEFGQRVEVKNMNSIRNVQRAIEHEVKRQYALIQEGKKVESETRSYNATDDTSFAMRAKEDAHDYRYFPEPDLQPIAVSQEYIDDVKGKLPPLPKELVARYTSELGLTEYDALVLTDSKPTALYYEALIAETSNYKSAANWMMGAVKSWLNTNALPIEEFPLAPKQIADLIALIDEGKVSNNVAEKKLFDKMIEEPEASPLSLAEANDWLLQDKTDEIVATVRATIDQFPDKVEAYCKGNKNLLGMFMGQVMRATKGQADPQKANKLVRELLEEKCKA